MSSFEDMGLRAELLRALEEEDLTVPTALQAAVIPALRRGGNIVARASSGSGKTLTYVLGGLDRLNPVEAGDEDEDEAGVRFIVITSTASEAEHVALAAVPYAQALGLTIAVAGRGWGTPISGADLVVTAPRDVLGAVDSSVVKLDNVETVVIDGASTIVDLGDGEHVDTLLELMPRDAQRVVISGALTDPVQDLIERRVKRALRFPPEPALPGKPAAGAPEGTIGYVLVPAADKIEVLAGQLGATEPRTAPPIIFCRNDERAAALAEQLAIRGFIVGHVTDEAADVAIAAGGTSRAELIASAGGAAGQTISYDVPADADTLRSRHAGDEHAVAMVEPRELAHLKEIARRTSFRAESTSLPRQLPALLSAIDAFRDEARAALQQEDLTAQMLVLEPLFEEFAPTEVAAALSALLRTRRSPAPSLPQAPPPPAERTASQQAAPAGPPPVTWARLFVSVGDRDEIRKGDLVGALAGEANIPGSQIGKIEIRDAFSIVEVQADVADRVIRAVNGTTIRGRSVRVDYDRGGPARRPGPGGGPARRTTRKPPGGG